MKRSDLFIRLTTGVLFLAVASYIGVYVYNAVINPYVTTTAISYAIEETFPAQGFIVRTETVLPDFGDAVLPVVAECEKVASGQAVAVEYLSRAALETASELRSLRFRIAQVEASGGRAAGASRLDSVMELSRVVHSGDLSSLDEISVNIETLVFTSSTPDADLPAMQARLEALERRSQGIRTIYAPVSGTFSNVVDGFESISPRAIADISPSRLSSLFEFPASSSGVGKLVTEFKWYYAAVMATEDAVRLAAGHRIPVQFSGAFNRTVDMLVESIGRREDGQSVVIFSSDQSIQDVAPLRQLRAEVYFGAVSGIRVPKEALRLDDDNVTYVYLQTGVRAERVNVEILRVYSDVYLVRDGMEAGTPLRSGSTIIVRANNLYHGKVVA
jgi:hypothetical protein